jgi:hypothetical protein
MADVSEPSSYIVEVFRVVGGTDHAKFMHSHFGSLSTSGLTLEPSEAFGFETLMRSFQTDPKATPGWSATWKIDDRFGYAPPDSDVHLRYTDLTSDAEASTAEAWVALGLTSYEEAWIPRIMVRRRSSEGPLASTFVGVIEPYEDASEVKAIRRLSLTTESGEPFPDACVAVEVALKDGRTDLIVAADTENPQGLTPSMAGSSALVQADWGLRLEGELCVVRRSPSGEVTGAALWNGSGLRVGEAALELGEETEFVEAAIKGGRPTILSGEAKVK